MKKQKVREHMQKVKEVQMKLGVGKNTINTYQNIYKQYLLYMGDEDAFYDPMTYQQFLLDHYDLDITKENSRKNTHVDNLYRSKELLDDLGTYVRKLNKAVVVNNQKDIITEDYKKLIVRYEYYCKEIRLNSGGTVYEKKNYISNILAYFQNEGITNITDVNESVINSFINHSINKGNRSKSRYFYVLRDFLKFLYSEDILLHNFAYLLPAERKHGRERIPTVIKVDKVKELLDSIPRKRKVDKRNYAIILMASELGMRISDILNLRFENINWKKKVISFHQVKTKGLNVLFMSNELGWALIDYIQNGRPITNERYVFVQHSFPYGKLKNFSDFNKYFEKIDIDLDANSKKGIHNLRHCLATRMLENEIPLNIISPILGHASLETTTIYLKIDIKKLKGCGKDVK